MFKRLYLLLLLSACPAFGQGTWLTVLGDPANPVVNTIQVDPTPLSVTDGGRVLKVRVSRSADRTSWDGVPYRSYESTVLFDCVNNTARYMRITYYKQPAWNGAAKAVDYGPTVPRWMQFREVEPNPHERIVHAACGGGRVDAVQPAAAGARK